MLDLREKTYPVIDLHAKLDVPITEKDVDSRNVLVMMKHGGEKVGLLVDKIVHSTHVDVEQIRGTEKSTLVIKPDALHALAETDQGLVHIVNIQQVIEAKELSARRLMEELHQQAEKQSCEASGI